jgi:hypothetical protein
VFTTVRQFRGPVLYFVTNFFFYEEEFLAPRPTPKLKNRLLYIYKTSIGHIQLQVFPRLNFTFLSSVRTISGSYKANVKRLVRLLDNLAVASNFVDEKNKKGKD